MHVEAGGRGGSLLQEDSGRLWTDAPLISLQQNQQQWGESGGSGLSSRFPLSSFSLHLQTNVFHRGHSALLARYSLPSFYLSLLYPLQSPGPACCFSVWLKEVITFLLGLSDLSVHLITPRQTIHAHSKRMLTTINVLLPSDSPVD